jgi:signal transduction histidine kinase/DNA-binding response OmpR family regulator
VIDASAFRQPRYSLKYRIAAIIFLLEAVMMAAVLGVTLGYSRNETEKQLIANEQVMLQLLGDLSRVALLTAEYDELQPYIEEVVRDPHVKTVLLADRRGRVVVSNEHGYLGGELPAFHDTATMRWLTRPVINTGGNIGTLAIRFSHEDIERTNREVRNLGVSIALVGMTLIAVVGVLIGHLLTRRLDVLSGAARRLADGDLTVRAGLGGHDEVAIVGQAFDTMARRVAENVEALQRATDLLEQHVADRTRELAVARDEAIAANRSKSAFLANMSHEIRTPLTAIIGFSETLLDASQPMAERVESIRTIIRGGKHLLRIINDILDVSKIEADKIEIESIPVNPFEVLEDVEAIVTLLAQEKGLGFHVEHAFPLPTRIVSDPLRLKQILINLCNNAIKFTSRGSVRVKLSCDPEREIMTFKVIDTGIGMSPAQMSHVFQAFVQADASTTREYGGTGLGLYLSRQLAARLGGDITVESTPEVGSCFTLTIRTGPLGESAFVRARPTSPQPVADPAAEQIAVSGEVLVAEDNPDNQKLISFLLRRAGAGVTVADNGEKAVEAALAGRFDLVLMDVQMPVLNGVDATRRLRQQGYRGAIVALTANALKSDVDACLAAGCNDFSPKPIQKEQLHELLKRYLPAARGAVSRAAPIYSSLLETEPALLDLVIEFVRRLPENLRELKADFARGDTEALRAHTHALKGTAGNFGYPDLHRLCQFVEFELAKMSEPGIAHALGEMEGIVERISRGLPGNVVSLPRSAAGPD